MYRTAVLLGRGGFWLGMTAGACSVPTPLATGPQTNKTVAPAVIEMVRIPGGQFMMGSAAGVGPSKERPQHRVAVAPFELDVTEVTVAKFAACVRTGACEANDASVTEHGDAGTCNYGKDDKVNHPMNCVDWATATAYCRAQGKRLPTEEEWEFAARGGPEERNWPWGNDEPSSQLCWEGTSRRDGTCAVGSFALGPYGLADMGGNVWEWTSNNYAADYSQVPSDAARAVRGGCWSSVHAAGVRGASRDGAPPSLRGSIVGFRCAR